MFLDLSLLPPTRPPPTPHQLDTHNLTPRDDEATKAKTGALKCHWEENHLLTCSFNHVTLNKK